MLTKEALLAVRPVPVRATIAIGDLQIYVREINAKQTITFEQHMNAARGDTQKLFAVQLSTFVCSEDGAQILSIDEADEFSERLSPSQARAIVEAGIAFNGLGEKDIEAAVGNSEPSP